MVLAKLPGGPGISSDGGQRVCRAWFLLRAVRQSQLRPESLKWKVTEAVNQVACSQQWAEALDIAEALGDEGLLLPEQLQRAKIRLHSEMCHWRSCMAELFRHRAFGGFMWSWREKEPGTKRPVLQTLRAQVISHAWNVVLDLLQKAADNAVLSRKTIWEFALSAMAYDGFTAPKTSLLEQYLAEMDADESSFSWVRATGLLRNMRSSLVRIGRMGSTLLLSALGRSRPWRETLGIMRQREAEGIPLQEESFRKMLLGLTRSRAWQMASWMVEEQISQLRFPLRGKLAPAVLHAATVTANLPGAREHESPMSFGRTWRKVMELLEDSEGSVTVSQKSQLESAICSYARSMELKRALQLLKDFARKTVQVSGVAHGFAMHAAALKQQWSTAFVLYDALRQASGRPSGVTVNNLALALRRLLGRQWVSTTLLLEEMRLQQLRSNVVFLGNAVQSYSTCRRWSRALQLCMATGQVGIKCDAYVLSNVMSGMGRMVEWRRSLEVLEQADRKVAGQEDPALLNTAMSALAAAGEDVLALKLLKEMPNMQVRMDVISMATLIKAFERRSCWSKALEMLGQLPQRELGWSSIACSSAISSCRKGCHWTWTLHVLHLHSVQDTSCSAKRGVLPRTGPEESSYCCTVHACGEKSAWPDAIFLIDVMRAQRLRTSDVLFQHLPGIFMEPRRART